MGSTVNISQVSVASDSECIVICSVSEKISNVPPHGVGVNGVEVNDNLLLFTLPSVKKRKKQLKVQKL